MLMDKIYAGLAEKDEETQSPASDFSPLPVKNQHRRSPRQTQRRQAYSYAGLNLRLLTAPALMTDGTAAARHARDAYSWRFATSTRSACT